jgi:hypothetical protein
VAAVVAHRRHRHHLLRRRNACKQTSEGWARAKKHTVR